MFIGNCVKYFSVKELRSEYKLIIDTRTFFTAFSSMFDVACASSQAKLSNILSLLFLGGLLYLMIRDGSMMDCFWNCR